MHSLYLHIPFCRKACHYCDFHFSTTLKRKAQMVNALCKELIIRKEEAQGKLQTIYFGGGTPSVLNINELEKILRTISRHYRIASNTEITLEANPDDFSGNPQKKALLKEIKHIGINRLSIGIQSFFEEDLRLMNRSHNHHQARTVLEDASLIFKNLSVDLIYALPKMDSEKWLKNLQIATDYGIPHLSVYALTVEEKTALAHFIRKGKIPAVNENQAHQHFFLAKQFLENKGFIHYEFSNFGKENFFSRNNTAYWEGRHYIGIGPSAHSYNGHSRSWNIAHNIKYIQGIEQGKRIFQQEILSESDKYNELILTRLRTQKGINLNQLKTDFGQEFASYLKKQSAHFLEKGLLYEENGYLKISPQGLFLSDGIASDLFWV